MSSKKLSKKPRPIGVFDSGVGGLSVLRAIRQALPAEDLLYVADQTHVPYGNRSREEIHDLSVGITEFLLNQGAKLIVVACNTASAAALHDLRRLFLNVPFVGMEPAVKPAAERTHTGVVGVLATPTTFSGKLYASVVERFAQDVQIIQETCPGLVEKIEAAELESPAVRKILEDALKPMLSAGIDTVVMGCTHYPFVIPLIEDITGPGVRVIDPAPAIARQTMCLLEEFQLLNEESSRGAIHLLTSGDTQVLEGVLPALLGEQAPVAVVKWDSVSLPETPRLILPG